ncbi:MAG TPA: lysophospholipid acyltransferase family protein [Pirellulaceae bacterium]|nr:lysophospholipid acyltransferase family protein [Pirellulaceae bacterium]HMO91524.1 lysophospholipid acyltransferase family protein [Pirellulaceae bacterium]HMP68221.1 lysophospholipid acyltransferase family protein [Pirellulaceae bacterium]
MTNRNQENQLSVRPIQRYGGVLMATVMRQMVRSLDLRASHYDRSVNPGLDEYGEHVIFVFWHEYIFPLLPQWANRPLTLLVSQHRDAEWLNQAAIRLGYDVVRGSTNRGGANAIRTLKRYAKHSSFAITPDGPRGPRREMAVGPIFLASLLNMPIVPVGVGCDRPMRLLTWDRFAIPRICSRVRIVFGPKIEIPRKSKTENETYRVKIQSLIEKLTNFAEDWAVSGRSVIGEERLSNHAPRQTKYSGNHRVETYPSAAGENEILLVHSRFPPLGT